MHAEGSQPPSSSRSRRSDVLRTEERREQSRAAGAEAQTWLKRAKVARGRGEDDIAEEAMGRHDEAVARQQQLAAGGSSLEAELEAELQSRGNLGSHLEAELLSARAAGGAQ